MRRLDAAWPGSSYTDNIGAGRIECRPHADLERPAFGQKAADRTLGWSRPTPIVGALQSCPRRETQRFGAGSGPMWSRCGAIQGSIWGRSGLDVGRCGSNPPRPSLGRSLPLDQAGAHRRARARARHAPSAAAPRGLRCALRRGARVGRRPERRRGRPPLGALALLPERALAQRRRPRRRGALAGGGGAALGVGFGLALGLCLGLGVASASAPPPLLGLGLAPSSSRPRLGFPSRAILQTASSHVPRRFASQLGADSVLRFVGEERRAAYGQKHRGIPAWSNKVRDASTTPTPNLTKQVPRETFFRPDILRNLAKA